MKRITLLILLTISLFGCEKYLDKVEESTGMTGEDVFTDYLNFRKFEDRMYKDMHNYLSAGDYTYIAALCDEGHMGPGWETITVAQNGDWLRSYKTGQALQFYGVWNGWESIRIANMVLENLYQLEGIATQEQINELKGQAHFMRAWYYYEFLKRQGGMPYITHSLGGQDNFALPRLSVHETALMIAADCDTAAGLLPDRWDNANLGRPTEGAAMALKSSALLVSASPTNNPDGDQSRWELVAQAAWDLIDFSQSTGRYKLLTCNSTDHVTYMIPRAADSITATINYTGGFDSIFLYQPFHDEIIWEHYPSSYDGGTFTVFTVPSLNSGGVIQGFSPTVNIVDLFETSNGLAIEDDPAYNPDDPYNNRDPRFYHSIVFNGERWTTRKVKGKIVYIELWAGGRERLNAPLYSYTGYLARKFWGKDVDQWSGARPPYTHTIYFRYAEILMQYAEAANEIGGPNYTLPGASMSAVEAVNLVRARVKMPPVNNQYLGSKEAFRERIKNERAVEFYLEGKRLFDLSRWGDAHKIEHKALYALDITLDVSKPNGYRYTKASTPFFTLGFEQKHYKWPIPLEDAMMFPEFEQNPGW
ncbi:MAG: RagB/SusD family nutrient uptake outer membrane protein [Bacteroidota bacterium]